MDCTIVVLGATGDLARKKIIPSIYNLLANKKIHKFALIGVARDNTSAESLIEKSKKYIKNLKRPVWNKLKNQFYYLKSDFYDKEFCDLGKFVRNVEKKHGLSGNRLFYLATLPEHFEAIANNLKECKLSQEKSNWTRVVFEKPFGHDLKSAKHINKCIKKVFSEKQIYRIDHYLGKELIQNIAVARFTNTILEPLWNNKYIDHVQIILSENIGIKGREAFYDKYGAIRDVIQNHMMQMLSLTAMESPKNLSGNFIRNEKVKVLESIKTTSKIIIGQYKGYTNEKSIPKNSKTETFTALKLSINNKRWKDVPFYLMTGKHLKNKITSIYIQFKQAPCLLFKKVCNFNPNYLVIQIQPEEGFYIQMNAKMPGKTDISPVKLDFCHECTFGPHSPEAYENLLSDVMDGDQSVFVRTDEIEEQWKITDKIKRKKLKLNKYKKGEYPEQANQLVRWHLKVK